MGELPSSSKIKLSKSFSAIRVFGEFHMDVISSCEDAGDFIIFELEDPGVRRSYVTKIFSVIISSNQTMISFSDSRRVLAFVSIAAIDEKLNSHIQHDTEIATPTNLAETYNYVVTGIILLEKLDFELLKI